jgi:hypothetical protein
VDGGEADEDEGRDRDEDTAGARDDIFHRAMGIGRIIDLRRRSTMRGEMDQDTAVLMTDTGRIIELRRRTMSEEGKASVG